MKQSDELGNLAAALAKVQGQLRPAEENSLNPFFKSKYADIASIIAAARTLLADNGLSVSQFPGPTYNGESHHYATLTTILMHESGEWLSQDLTMPLAKVDPQGYGSAITYARRYALASVLGIVAGEDDDGNVATGGKQWLQKQPTTTSQARYDDKMESIHEPDEPDSKTVDARAWLTGEAKNGMVIFGYVADALGMAGLLNADGNGAATRKHFKNWLLTDDCQKIVDALKDRGIPVDMRVNIPLKTALYIFDKRVEDKAVNDG